MIFPNRFLKILNDELVLDRMALKMKYVLTCYFWYSYYDEENQKDKS